MDEQIKDLQERIKFLEMNNQFEADKAAVQAIEYQMLEKLRKLRQEVADASSSSHSSGVTSSKELKALQQENEMLKKKVAKQAYRIEHLVQGIMDMQTKIASAPSN